MALAFPSIEDVIAINAKTIELSGGGLVGVLDIGKLEGVLAHIQNDDYYPELVDKLTHLFFCIAKFHCFRDGNKRTAIAVCTHMLLINGYLYCATSFLRDIENIVVWVADNTINKDLLNEIIGAHISQEWDSEELKLKIYEAVNAQGCVIADDEGREE